MKKGKFFNLIDGRPVDIAPGKKVLSADALTTLLDSTELLENVKKDAEEYKKKIIGECESIKEQAEREGFQAGYDQWADQLAQLEKEIQNVREELQKVVMPVALKAAKKIVASELELRPDAIKQIVAETLRSVAQHKRIVLYVSREDFERIESEKNEIKKIFDELESLSLREREDIEPGGCVIETEIGIVNARLQDRWKTLEVAVDALSSRVKQGSEE